MTTPERSESEIANEYSERIRERLHHFYGNTAAEHEIVAILKIALTTALQAERKKRDEAVEAERERIGKVINKLRPILWSDSPETHTCNIRLTNNLNTIEKAIPPTNDKHYEKSS